MCHGDLQLFCDFARFFRISIQNPQAQQDYIQCLFNFRFAEWVIKMTLYVLSKLLDILILSFSFSFSLHF